MMFLKTYPPLDPLNMGFTNRKVILSMMLVIKKNGRGKQPITQTEIARPDECAKTAYVPVTNANTIATVA